MYRNRKTAAILVVAAGLVLALIFAVGHSLAANGKPSSDQTPTASDGSSSNADNGSAGNGTDLVLRGGQDSRPSHSSGASGSGQTGNGTSGSGSTTTTPPTTTPPGGGGHKPPFPRPGQVSGGTFGLSDPGTPPTTTPPNHNPVGGGAGCVHKQGFACP